MSVMISAIANSNLPQAKQARSILIGQKQRYDFERAKNAAALRFMDSPVGKNFTLPEALEYLAR